MARAKEFICVSVVAYGVARQKVESRSTIQRVCRQPTFLELDPSRTPTRSVGYAARCWTGPLSRLPFTSVGRSSVRGARLLSLTVGAVPPKSHGKLCRRSTSNILRFSLPVLLSIERCTSGKKSLRCVQIPRFNISRARTPHDGAYLRLPLACLLRSSFLLAERVVR